MGGQGFINNTAPSSGQKNTKALWVEECEMQKVILIPISPTWGHRLPM